MKTLSIILGIVAAAAIATAVIFIVKNSRTNRKLKEANAALVALGAPEVKSAKPTDSSAVASGTQTGTATDGTPAGVNAAVTPAEGVK